MRIQTREDGVSIDQVVLSASTYLTASPGQLSNDATIIAKPAASASPSTSGPYSGTPAALPGQVNAETFDNGGEGVAYHDTTPGNAGGQVRSTDVDIEPSSDGGFDIGWTAPGEWVNYTVNVAAAGQSSRSCGSRPSAVRRCLGFNKASVSGAPSRCRCGGWQNWTTVQVR